MKVLHVLETSIPHTVGYTVRARAILENQKRLGLEVVAVTSPLFPSDNPVSGCDELGGIRYYRTNDIARPDSARSRLGSYLTRLLMLKKYRQAVHDVALREKVDVIHAHSSYSNAYAAMPAARALGKPLLYEVRTLWGESAVVEDGWRPDSLKHRLIWRLELGAMQRVDRVVPIAQGIHDELAARGVSPGRMTVVPNGVDTAQFVPVIRDEGRADSVGLAGRFVVGFVGSMRKLEGLSTLLEACSICQKNGLDMGLLLVGDGPDRRQLESGAAALGLRNVVFTGNVPHDDVAGWYSIMDAVAYPRIRAVINERVTPLKPLEVMAMGQVCVGSDVGGLTELIKDGETGLIFRSDDPGHLAATLARLHDDPGLGRRLGQAGLAYVKAEREWAVIVGRYLGIYESLAAQANGRRRNQPSSHG